MRGEMIQRMRAGKDIPVKKLSQIEAEAELKRLAAEIAEHDRRYYQEDAPTVSDAEYDALRARNAAIEARFPALVRLDSPSRHVGAAPSKGFRRIRHRIPVLSLDDAYADQDVADFVERVHRLLHLDNEVVVFTAEPKIDGLSLSLCYEAGRLVSGATRGDGMEGEDVTANVRTIPEITQHLKGNEIPKLCEVRGEVYMTKSAFLRLNRRQQASGGEVFANSRNAAAGSLRQFDPSVTASRSLGFFAYAWGEMSHMPADTQSGMEAWFGFCGFKINPLTRRCRSIGELLAFHQELEFERGLLDYDIDGVVYKVDRIDWQNRLGFVSRSPAGRWRTNSPPRKRRRSSRQLQSR